MTTIGESQLLLHWKHDLFSLSWQLPSRPFTRVTTLISRRSVRNDLVVKARVIGFSSCVGISSVQTDLCHTWRLNWPVLTDSAEGPVPRAALHRRGERRSDRGDGVPQWRRQTRIHCPLLHPSGLGAGRLWLWWTAQHRRIHHHILTRYFGGGHTHRTFHLFLLLLKKKKKVSYRERWLPFHNRNSSSRNYRGFFALQIFNNAQLLPYCAVNFNFFFLANYI